jgi:hypothetical protein
VSRGRMGFTATVAPLAWLISVGGHAEFVALLSAAGSGKIYKFTDIFVRELG